MPRTNVGATRGTSWIVRSPRRIDLQDFLDDAVILTALEAFGKRHAEAIEHRLPDAADLHVVQEEVSLVLETQCFSTTQHERELLLRVPSFALGGRPGGHRVVEQRAVAFLDALELADEV